MQRRLLSSALAAAALLSAAACADQLPTLAGDDEFPAGTIPVTREVIIPASEFFRFLGTFGGFTAIAAAPYQVVARDYEGLNAHALNKFAPFPTTVTYDSAGVERRDSIREFEDSPLVLRVDSAASTSGMVTLRVYAAAQPWDRGTATWQVATDTGGAPVPWTEPGGTRGALLGEGTWGGPADSDSVIVTLSAADLRALADSASHGIIITAVEAGRRVQLADVVLRLAAVPRNNTDTTVVINVGTSGSRTTVYTPDQPAPPPGVLAIGGVRGARSLVEIDPLVTVPGCAAGSVCDPVPLTEVRLNQVAVLFDRLDSPAGFDPLAPTPVTLRVVEEPELGRLAPLGPSIADRDAFFRVGKDFLELEITALTAAMATTDSFPTTFALLSESLLTTGPPGFGVGFFASDPLLRIVYTIPTRRRLP